MHHRDLLAVSCECGLHLQNTSRISRCHHIRLQRSDKLRFALPKRIGGIGLHEVEYSRGAAADGGLWNFSKLQPGNLGEQ